MKFELLLVASLAMLPLAACTDRKAEPDVKGAASPATPATHVVTDEWLGQWNGPEGTFLRLSGGKGKYEITIQDLDGPRNFQGTGLGNAIQFERNGTKELIRATSGADTGMKWLSEKANCLTVRAGEGYCRD